MNWLQEAFLEPTMVQAVIIISLVSALGLYLGRIKIFGISLGITFVFFAGDRKSTRLNSSHPK